MSSLGCQCLSHTEVNRNKVNIFNHIRKIKLKRSEEEGEQGMRIISQDGMDDIPYADTWFTMRQVEDHYEIQAEAKDGEMYLVAIYTDEKQAKTVFHGMYRHYLQDKKYYQLPREEKV